MIGGTDAAQARRTPCRAHQFSRRRLGAAASIEQCASLGKALARLHVAGESFRQTRANSLSLSDWGPLADAIGERADTVIRGLAAEIGKELAYLDKAWPRDLPQGVDPRRPLSRQRVLSRARGVRPDRLLLRLQRHARLRHRHLPQRLVLRVRRELQHHQGAGLPPGLRGACGRSRQTSWPRCRRLPAVRRCASCSPAPTTGSTPTARLWSSRKDPNEYLRKLRFHRKVKSYRDYGLGEH